MNFLDQLRQTIPIFFYLVKLVLHEFVEKFYLSQQSLLQDINAGFFVNYKYHEIFECDQLHCYFQAYLFDQF